MQGTFSARGIGLHTGKMCETTVCSAAHGHGIVFQTEDGPVAATVENADDTVLRCTTLCSERGRIQTVEHLLAAATLLGETDLLIHVVGPEIPALDGSALSWYRLFEEAGAMGRPRLTPLARPRVERITLGDAVAEVTPVEKDVDAFIEVCVDLKAIARPPLRHRFYPAFDRPEDIVAARTFAFENEVQYLLQNGLAQGGSLDNALVLGSNGPLNPGGLRHENEPARHKLLDAVGDLSLQGALPRAKIRLHRPGHLLNLAVARFLSQ